MNFEKLRKTVALYQKIMSPEEIQEWNDIYDNPDTSKVAEFVNSIMFKYAIVTSEGKVASRLCFALVGFAPRLVFEYMDIMKFSVISATVKEGLCCAFVPKEFAHGLVEYINNNS